MDSGNRTTILVHTYRALVGRADIWRMRMDTTTNWAIGATAAVITFALGNPSAPHYVVHLGSLMTLSFLLLEARRLTFYHLWQRRALVLERALIRPALAAAGAGPQAEIDDEALQALSPEIGRTVPTMPMAKAAARRLRRVYLYLFAVQLMAWLLKLSIHPTPAGSAAEWVERARVGGVPGSVVIAASCVALLCGATLAGLLGGVDRRATPP